MLHALYDSPWHNPVFYFAMGALSLLAFARRLPFLHAWMGFFSLEILLDAYITGGLSPVPPRLAPMLGTISVPFVILGDLRFFVLVERSAATLEPRAATPWRSLARTLALSFLVPVTSYGISLGLPRYFTNQRYLFLLYELLFLALALGYRLALMPSRLRSIAHAPTRDWLSRLARFELAQYALWIAADLLILAHSDAGYGLRFAPNGLYYAAFLPYAYFTAPREQRP